jgi:hypothetical protein
MPTIHVEAEVGQADLLKAVEQLDPAEFDHFVSQVLTLRARREAPGVSSSETELLLRINQGLPEELSQRYEELLQKRSDQPLTPEDEAEIQGLTDRVEQRQADRVQAMVDLARIRGVTLTKLMADLGITPPNDG